jgi:hypothetical protein
LGYLLRSIKKFASGFRNIVIVSDDDGNEIPEHYTNIIDFTVIYVKVPKTDINVIVGAGYVWQQCVKLSWYKYTDAESVVIIDSDEMLTCETTPDSFKKDGKYNWFYREWKDAERAICHKESTDRILNFDTKYECMCIPVFSFTLAATRELEQYLIKLYGESNMWNIIHKLGLNRMSEFNIYGNFINKIQHVDYNYVYDLSGSFNERIIVSWSWGGLKDEDRIKRENILSTE